MELLEELSAARSGTFLIKLLFPRGAGASGEKLEFKFRFALIQFNNMTLASAR